MGTRPNKAEQYFLNLGYNRFYDLFEEVLNEKFWDKNSWYRFSKVSQAFSIYTEILAYEPFKHVLDSIKKNSPPMEAEIAGPFFKFIRNLFIHFPVFGSWDDVWINKDLVNWNKKGLTIDRFLIKYSGYGEVKYRLWDTDKKLMSYLSIRFHESYGDEKIYLKDIISEKEGIKFSFVMMRNILNTQVESLGANE